MHAITLFSKYFQMISIAGSNDPPLGGSMRVAYNDLDDRAGLYGYLQINRYAHIHTHTYTDTYKALGT